eukprot:587745-Amphidinium_carterae.1
MARSSKTQFDTFVERGEALQRYTHILQLILKLRQAFLPCYLLNGPLPPILHEYAHMFSIVSASIVEWLVRRNVHCWAQWVLVPD